MFNFNDHLQGLRSTIMGMVLLLAATVIGFVWISIGLYHWLMASIGLVWGPIMLGLIYFIPVIIFAFVKAFKRPPIPPAAAKVEQVDPSLLYLSGIFENLSGRSPFFVVSSAIIAGFVVTRFPGYYRLFLSSLVPTRRRPKRESRQPLTKPRHINQVPQATVPRG